MKNVAQATAADTGEYEDIDKGTVSVASGYLTFELAGESYGLDILRVTEIRGWTSLTRIPDAPEFVEGVLDMRGTIVPIVDLRTRFGLEKMEISATTVVIVLTVESKDRSHPLGIIVDGVSDVVNINTADTRSTPYMGEDYKSKFVTGLAKVNNEMLMLLAVDDLFSEQQLDALTAAVATANAKA